MTSQSDCLSPGAVSPEEITAYATGEADAVITAHIEHCPACRAEAATQARLDRLLSVTLFRRSCPPTLAIGEYAQSLLGPDEARDMAAHLVDCPHCRAEQRRFAEFMAEPDPPLQGSPAAVTVPRVIAGLRRLLVQPLRGAAPALALPGLRGAGDGGSITYEAEGLRLTVSVQRSARGGRVVAGLLEPGAEPVAAGSAALYIDVRSPQREPGDDLGAYLLSGAPAGNYRLVQTEPVDDLGAFLFSGVPAGTYRLEVTVGEVVLVLEPLAVA